MPEVKEASRGFGGQSQAARSWPSRSWRTISLCPQAIQQFICAKHELAGKTVEEPGIDLISAALAEEADKLKAVAINKE